MTSWAGLTVHIHCAYVQVVFILLQEVMEIIMVNQLPLDHELWLNHIYWLIITLLKLNGQLHCRHIMSLILYNAMTLTKILFLFLTKTAVIAYMPVHCIIVAASIACQNHQYPIDKTKMPWSRQASPESVKSLAY